MPLYDYNCPKCGVFTEKATIEAFDKPQNCPTCGQLAERMLATPPANVMGGRAKGNQMQRGRKVKHAPGCTCGAC